MAIFDNSGSQASQHNSSVPPRLARVYYRGGMFQDSIAACRQAIKLKPDYSDAYFGLGLSLLKVRKKGKLLKHTTS